MRKVSIARDSYVETLLARRMNGFVKVITGIGSISLLMISLLAGKDIDTTD